MTIKQDILEHKTTWIGCKVGVTVEVPWMEHTLTTQMIVDSYHLECLANMAFPEETMDNITDPVEYQHHLVKFQQLEQEGQRVVDIISKQIASQLCRVVQQHPKTKSNDQNV